MEIFYDSNVVVTISFLLFFALLAYLGVHKFILAALDKRADSIRTELNEARQLREEAQELFADFERKQKEVEGLAEDIIANAKAEAESAAVRAKADLATSIERRLKAADEKIALAESDAVKEVRNTAISVAVAAASEVLTSKLGADQAEGLVENAIKDVGAKLH